MPNLLVFQQLVTLYLGGILVRVVSEIVWRNVQECARKTRSRDWISRVTRGCKLPEAAHVPGIPEVEPSHQLEQLQDKIGQLAIQLPRGWNLRLSQAVRPSCKPTMFWKTWLFTFYSHPSINTTFTHERKRAFRDNFKRETLEKNKIDSSPIFIKRLFKFLNFLPLHC